MAAVCHGASGRATCAFVIMVPMSAMVAQLAVMATVTPSIASRVCLPPLHLSSTSQGGVVMVRAVPTGCAREWAEACGVVVVVADRTPEGAVEGSGVAGQVIAKHE